MGILHKENVCISKLCEEFFFKKSIRNEIVDKTNKALKKIKKYFLKHLKYIFPMQAVRSWNSIVFSVHDMCINNKIKTHV